MISQCKCFTCHFNPLDNTQLAKARLINKMDFICQYNGFFRIKDMHVKECFNYERKTTQN